MNNKQHEMRQSCDRMKIIYYYICMILMFLNIPQDQIQKGPSKLFLMPTIWFCPTT